MTEAAKLIRSGSLPTNDIEAIRTLLATVTTEEDPPKRVKAGDKLHIALFLHHTMMRSSYSGEPDAALYIHLLLRAFCRRARLTLIA